MERKRGYESKAWAVELTRNAALEITKTHGQDRYERLVIDLSVDGQDIAQAGLEAGHYKPWPHDGSKALAKRPKWC